MTIQNTIILPLHSHNFSFNWEINDEFNNMNYIVFSIKEAINQNKMHKEDFGHDNTLDISLSHITDIIHLIPVEIIQDKNFLIKASDGNMDFIAGLVDYCFTNEREISQVYIDSLHTVLSNLSLYHFICFKDLWNFCLKTMYFLLKSPLSMIDKNTEELSITVEKFIAMQKKFSSIIHLIEDFFIQGNGFSYFQSIHTEVDDIIGQPLFLSILNQEQFEQHIIDCIFFENSSVVGPYDPKMLYHYLPEKYRLKGADYYNHYIKSKHFLQKKTALLEYYMQYIIPIEFYQDDNGHLDGDKAFFYLLSFFSKPCLNNSDYFFSQDYHNQFLKTFFNQDNIDLNFHNLKEYYLRNENFIPLFERNYFDILAQHLVLAINTKEAILNFLQWDLIWENHQIELFWNLLPQSFKEDEELIYFFLKYTTTLEHTDIVKTFDFNSLDMEKDLSLIQHLVKHNNIFTNEQFNSIQPLWFENLDILSHSREVRLGKLILNKEQWLKIINNEKLFSYLVHHNIEYFEYIPHGVLNKEQVFLLLSEYIEQYREKDYSDIQIYLKRLEPFLNDKSLCLNVLRIRYVDQYFFNTIPQEHWDNLDFCIAVLQLVDSNLFHFIYLPLKIQSFFKSYSIVKNYSESFEQIYRQKKLSFLLKDKINNKRKKI